MNKFLKYTLIAIFIIALLFAVTWVLKSNSEPVELFKTETAQKENIINKVVATGKVIPEDEIDIKPQIPGIIDKIYLEEGAKVKAGELIATIKVVPNEQALYQARGRVNNAKVNLGNSELDFKRNKTLFDKGVVSAQDFQNIQLTYNQAKLEVDNAQNDYQIIRKGSVGGSSSANTNIRATVDGTILEIPVEVGDQVIQSNNLNDGTTIATIADLNKMIFEGKVDEAEVGKLKVGMPLNITMGAVQGQELKAKLKFIAPKGIEDQGAVQFKIEGDVEIKDGFQARAGYSANAAIVLEQKDSVLAVKEALLQFDEKTEAPFVEILKGESEFERRDVELGVSDGIVVEILSGITKDDKIKIWNKPKNDEEGDRRRN